MWVYLSLTAVILCNVVKLIDAKEVFEKVYDKVYVNYTLDSYCVKRLNGTHEFGCGGPPRQKNIGVLHLIQDNKDLDYVTRTGPHDPYIALVEDHMFTRDVLLGLRDSGRVRGILLLHNASNFQSAFSGEKQCPGQIRGLYTNQSVWDSCKQSGAYNPWNPSGNGLLYEKFDFPIGLIQNQTVIDGLKSCYEQYNAVGSSSTPPSYPLCGVEMHAEMMAAGDAQICWRRTNIVNSLTTTRLCDPIGDKNIYLSVTNSVPPSKKDSVVMLCSRMDAWSLFYMKTPSAGSHVSSIVTILAAAQALNQQRAALTSAAKSLMIVFFQGESFDYIGSSRMADEMGKGSWQGNFTLEDLAEIIEVGDMTSPSDAYVHRDPMSTGQPAINTVVTDMENDFVTSSVKKGTGNKPLPPSSVQSFLKKRAIPSLVFSSYDTQFKNDHYFSIYDTAESMGIEKNASKSNPTVQNITKLASALASTLYKRVTGNTMTLTADDQTVSNLLQCYLYSSNCDLFLELAMDMDQAASFSHLRGPIDSYVGVSGGSGHTNRLLLYRMLGYFMGERLSDRVKSNCTAPESDKLNTYSWYVGAKNSSGYREGVCIRANMGNSSAKPVIFNDDYDYDGWETFAEATWVESQWNGNLEQLKMFLLPNPSWEALVLSVGCVLFVVALVISYLCQRAADNLFPTFPTPPTTIEQPL